MKWFPVLMVFAVAAALPAAAQPPEAARCESCHGPGGDSRDPLTPRLNGQKADYILARLKELHNPTTQTPHATQFMFDVTSSIGAKTAEALARYFAQQAPTPPNAAEKSAAQAKPLYTAGAGARVPSCQECHGVRGNGEGEGLAPRLGGQQTQYLERQLASFTLMSRYHRSMDAHARQLTAEEMKALAAWLGSD